MITFLIDNWLWIGLIAVFVAMHRGGHGCGSHGSHRSHRDHSASDPTQSAVHPDHHTKTSPSLPGAGHAGATTKNHSPAGDAPSQ